MWKHVTSKTRQCMTLLWSVPWHREWLFNWQVWSSRAPYMLAHSLAAAVPYEGLFQMSEEDACHPSPQVKLIGFPFCLAHRCKPICLDCPKTSPLKTIDEDIHLDQPLSPPHRRCVSGVHKCAQLCIPSHPQPNPSCPAFVSLCFTPTD